MLVALPFESMGESLELEGGRLSPSQRSMIRRTVLDAIAIHDVEWAMRYNELSAPVSPRCGGVREPRPANARDVHRNTLTHKLSRSLCQALVGCHVPIDRKVLAKNEFSEDVAAAS